MELESFQLLNLSQGGMKIQGIGSLNKGDLEYFLMNLTEPFPSIVLVRVEGRWAKPKGPGKNVMGVRILESSKAWLGKSDEEQDPIADGSVLS
jgi:hypothetical protein